MDIKLVNISIKNKIKNLNLIFNKKEITGVINGNYLIDLLLLNIDYSGNYLLDNKLIKEYSKKYISYINSNPYFYTNTVSDEFYLVKKDINSSKYIEKIESSLNMVGLSKEYLNKKIKNLSTSEKKLLQLALKLITNPEVILIDNIFMYLDNKNRLRIKELLNTLIKEYNKTIILFDNNINNIYELSNQIVIFKDNNLLISGKTNVVFNDIDFLINNNICLPDIIKFINDSNKYEIKLTNTNNINELIKDVYKNVKESKK